MGRLYQGESRWAKRSTQLLQCCISFRPSKWKNNSYFKGSFPKKYLGTIQLKQRNKPKLHLRGSIVTESKRISHKISIETAKKCRRYDNLHWRLTAIKLLFNLTIVSASPRFISWTIKTFENSGGVLFLGEPRSQLNGKLRDCLLQREQPWKHIHLSILTQ